jgi:hypothetical protein
LIITDAYEALPEETDHMTKKSRRGFTKALAWEILQIKKMQSFRVAGPKSDAHESKRF